MEQVPSAASCVLQGYDRAQPVPGICVTMVVLDMFMMAATVPSVRCHCAVLLCWRAPCAYSVADAFRTTGMLMCTLVAMMMHVI